MTAETDEDVDEEPTAEEEGTAGEGDEATVEDIAAAPEEGETLSDIASDVDPAVVEEVEERDAEDVAAELDRLRSRVAEQEHRLSEREAEIEDLESRLARKQADFQNYKQRQEKKMEDVKQRATEDLVERLLDVRDNLQRALEQDEGADIRPGVESTLSQFDEELARENVERIEPDPGTETDPHRHEVLMRVESDQPEGTVADLHRPGYEMGGQVIREAQVTVSEGED